MGNVSNGKVVEQTFDGNINDVIKNMEIDIHREKTSRMKNELPFADVSEKGQLQIYANYINTTFCEMYGEEVLIEDERLADALGALTEIEREILLQSVVFQRPLQAIGDELGIPRTTLNDYKKRILMKLEELY